MKVVVWVEVDCPTEEDCANLLEEMMEHMAYDARRGRGMEFPSQIKFVAWEFAKVVNNYTQA